MLNIQPRSDHHLKFLESSPNHKYKIQKKCFPHHTYGVSAEAPVQFQKKHSLVNNHGYVYLHQSKHATGTNQFHNFTQQKFFTIHNGQHDKQFAQQYKTDYHQNPKVFHKKRGLLTQYMQKNGWMSKVHKLMGHERTNHARALSNDYRSEKIKSLKKPPNSIEFQMTQVLKKEVNSTYFDEVPNLMSEKMRIRKKRNSFFEKIQQQKIKSQKKLGEPFYIQNFTKKQLGKQLQSRAQTSRTKYMQNFRESPNLTTHNWKTNRLISTHIDTHRPINNNDQDQINDYCLVDEQSQSQNFKAKPGQKQEIQHQKSQK